MAAKGSDHPKATAVRKALKAEAASRNGSKQPPKQPKQPSGEQGEGEQGEQPPVSERLVMLSNTLTELVDDVTTDDVATLKAIRARVDAALERVAAGTKQPTSKSKAKAS